ncbi:ThiJ/PfpI family protein [Colletotrichum truncatum]|uniref:ThiJ/PfpI family protein n=1 Tax=Colletotrichum truncatum TaxID=5467 RepID=A0ACC3YY35_COLTU
METVKIGVFVTSHIQLLDLACIDVFEMMGKPYLGAIDLSEPIIDMAPNVEIFHISPSPAGTAIPASANARLITTHCISDHEVQPGRLDILVVLGSRTEGTYDKEVMEFLRGHAEDDSTDILIISGGIALCRDAGLLKGRTIAEPQGFRNTLNCGFKDVRLVGDKSRWTQDGNLWSSGGMANGNDLIAAYVLQSQHFAKPVAEIALSIAQIGHRSQEF